MEEVEVNPLDVCIGFICPVGKNILELVDAKPTVGIGGSGNIVDGVDAVIFGTAIDADVEVVDTGTDPIGADVMAKRLLSLIIETWGGAKPCCGTADACCCCGA